MTINWRASLVPAAAVIPAPIGYIKVVAVEKLVVVFLVGWCILVDEEQSNFVSAACHFVVKVGLMFRKVSIQLHSVTESKLECSKQALQLWTS